ncbi:hypothetical protein CLV30_12836 [Haloactinopolyspora alba]|uniref:Uncharacterized protein n=1 Tax=Haloactinopolyspora alba TaxID=648780 RepID=A0A2P8DEY5_9ACTN|nr:hypothetical protein [Haloactinopolyspora alba]PSK95784.1 hypothetical protein CLV30_12836 [Haloactinopolyspora alba]
MPYEEIGDLATYVVTTGGDTSHEVLADSWKNEDVDGDFGGGTASVTRFYRAGKVVAEFRWHDSIVRKGE